MLSILNNHNYNYIYKYSNTTNILSHDFHTTLCVFSETQSRWSFFLSTVFHILRRIHRIIGWILSRVCRPNTIIPVYFKSRNSRLVPQYIALYFIKLWLRWWIFPEFRVRVLVIYKITNTYKFVASIRAGKEDDSDSQCVIDWNSAHIWWISLTKKFIFTTKIYYASTENFPLLPNLLNNLFKQTYLKNKHVSAFRNGSNVNSIKNLIKLFRLSAANVNHLPF